MYGRICLFLNLVMLTDLHQDPAYAFVRYFLEVSDVAMFSYYPPNHHIEHTETVVRAAFDVMKSPLGDKLFLFTEIGYPSGAA